MRSEYIKVAKILSPIYSKADGSVSKMVVDLSSKRLASLKKAMECAAAEDTDCPEGDPAARGGKWHRAANIVNARAQRYATETELFLATADWSFYLLMSAMGISRETIDQQALEERIAARQS